MTGNSVEWWACGRKCWSRKRRSQLFVAIFDAETNHRPNVPAAVMLVPFQDVKQGTIKRHVAILFNTLDRFNEGESPKTVPITELMTQRVKTSLELHYSHSASLISAGHEGTMLPSSKRRQWGNGKKQGTTWWCHLVRDSQRQTTSDIVKFMTRGKLHLGTRPKQWDVRPMTTDEALVPFDEKYTISDTKWNYLGV